MVFKLFGRSHEEPEDKKPTAQAAPAPAEVAQPAAASPAATSPAAPQPLSSEPPTPVSMERVTEIFRDNGWNYETDEDGDAYGGWGNGFFIFQLGGQQKEVLCISGRTRYLIPADKIDDARIFIEDWHRTKHWPKAYVFTDDDGDTSVKTEVTIDHEHGATKDQLQLHVTLALDTTLAMFKELAEQLNIETDKNSE